ncbi:MAG: PspC domain-containing protein [bacterium]|nr:PspC domain-containing protein [bacterium]
MNRLYRSRDQRILSGICGGFGKYFNLDPTIVRILWVVLGIGSFGTALILYVILIFVIPEEPIV